MRALSRSAVALLAAVGTVGVGLAQAQQQGPLRELFGQLDANQNGVIEREEIPPSARPAFERVLKHGDRNHNGKLEADEYKAVLVELRDFTKQAGKQVAQKFQAMDKDGDGKISRSEFPGPRARFDQLDKDSDGYLTREELAGAIQAKNKAKSAANKKGEGNLAEALLERFRAIDKNGDGRLSRDEFPGGPMLFDRLDSDKDGFLNRAELRPIRALKKAS
jgi:Ca2+-binding EF-hand superfamily protein